MKKNILITGGAGFIGSHVVRLFVNKYPDYQIFNLDALTYAGNLENLKDIEKAANYHFLKANILEADSLKTIFEKHAITDVIHLAAESHVDRSITDPLAFVKTNVFGIGGFARYYFLDLGARFKTYAEAGAAFGSQKESITGVKANGFGLGAGLGLQYFVTEKIAINFGLSDILSYTSAKVDGGKAESEFEGNVNVFNNFFTTTQFGLTFKI